MIPLFSTSQIREIDDFAINELGIPGSILMENASVEIFRISYEAFSALKSKIYTVGFVCGKGNNGGDGYATARHFANHGYNVFVLQIGSEDEMSEDCSVNYNILHSLSEYNPSIKTIEFKKYSNMNELKKCDAVFDAVLGSGAKGNLLAPLDGIIQFVNKLSAFKIAIDIPTGLDADKGSGKVVFEADLTITLAEFKKGLFFGTGYLNCGKIEKGGIGIDPDYFRRIDTNYFLIDPEDVIDYLPRKKKNINKYTSGKVFTVAGSGEFPGAAVMTSKSAFKVGAGASVLAFPRSIRRLISRNLTEVVVNSYSAGGGECLKQKDIKDVNKRIRWADVVALGPGLGRHKSTQTAVRSIIRERLAQRLIIDADGLYPLNNEEYRKYNLTGYILTPHHGEFASLIGVSVEEIKDDITGYGLAFVRDTGTYLVLKGAPTIIFTPEKEVFINSAGNPGMAKFGMGDVLTGVLAGILSQQKDIKKAIIASVYIHSLAGDLLSKKSTNYGYTASDLIENLPAAIKFLRDSFV